MPMNSLEALQKIGVSASDMTGSERRELDANGYFIIPAALSPEQCSEMAAEVDRIAAIEGEKAGSEVSQEAGTLRISNIFNKSAVFDPLLTIKPLLAASHYLLGEFKVHGANVREPRQGGGKQPLHADSVKLPDGGWCIVNSLICFDAMTLDNGPTRVVPGSHNWAPLNVPGENALDYSNKPRDKPHKWAAEGDRVEDHVAASPVVGDTSRAPADAFAPYPGEVLVTVPAGSVVVCNAHMWHSGTQKHGAARRRQLHLSYTRRDMPQQLIQRKFLTPEFNARLSDAHRFLLDIA
jgi:hypothetical protein